MIFAYTQNGLRSPMTFVTVKNSLSNCIPNKTFRCDDRDPPCSKKVKQLNIAKQND